jgi:hypothetical protein
MPTSPDDEPELGDLLRSNEHVVGTTAGGEERFAIDEVDSDADGVDGVHPVGEPLAERREDVQHDVTAHAGPGRGFLATGGPAMSDGDLGELIATMQARTRRVIWFWILGEAWLTLLRVGFVVVRLWAR